MTKDGGIPIPSFSVAMGLVVVGGLLYGSANWLSGKYYLPGCSFSEMRPQVALPLFFGVWLGPWPGFICGCFGDMFGYLLGGKGLFFAPYWSVANGLMGLIAGLARYIRARPVDSIPAFARLLTLLLAAIGLPFLLSSWVTYLVGAMTLRAVLYRLYLPIVVTDVLWALLFMPPLLRACRLLIVRIEMRTTLTLYYLVIFAVLAAWLAGISLDAAKTIQPENMYALGALTLMVLIAALVIAGVSAKRLIDPMLSLTGAAQRVAAGDYANLKDLQAIGCRSDELGTLATVFTRMVQAVARREQNLQKQVSDLKIEIDHRRQQEEIERITDTDYFQMLKRKAGDLRQSHDPRKKS